MHFWRNVIQYVNCKHYIYNENSKVYFKKTLTGTITEIKGNAQQKYCCCTQNEHETENEEEFAHHLVHIVFIPI